MYNIIIDYWSNIDYSRLLIQYNKKKQLFSASNLTKCDSKIKNDE